MIIQYIMDQDEANDHNTLFSMVEVEVVIGPESENASGSLGPESS